MVVAVVGLGDLLTAGLTYILRTILHMAKTCGKDEARHMMDQREGLQ
jgi:hypothetical protein